MLTKQQKQKIIEELADKIKSQKGLVFSDFKGLKVGEIEDLRKDLRKEGIDYKIAKKTLIKLALEKAEKKVDMDQFKNSIALALGFEDPIMPAKIINNFTKKHKNLKILGGLMDDRFLTIEEVKGLAAIPSKNELLFKLIYSLKSPMGGFVNVLKGTIANLVGVLSAISNK